MNFTKMHGLGNDFIVFDDLDDLYTDYSDMAIKLCDRHFGIGGDGILIAKKSDTCQRKMLIYNSDGSEASMCGNGIRCFAKYLYDKGYENNKMSIDTLDGIKEAQLIIEKEKVKAIKVKMGKPEFRPRLIPSIINKDRIVDETVTVDGIDYAITSMFLGVPHTIIFVEDVMDPKLMDLGKKVEKSCFFPNGTNVNFVKVINKKEYDVRTWERGAGATLACGTGACASLVAAALSNKCDKKAMAHLYGGDMTIEWNDDGYVFMTGPAETVFEGKI